MGWIDNRIAEYYQWQKDNTAIREDKVQDGFLYLHLLWGY